MTISPLLNHPVITQRYFFPRNVSPSTPHWVDCGDASLACIYHEPNPEWPTIVHFHGNGEIVSDYATSFPEIFEQMQHNCCLAEYRGYGGSTGQPELGKMLDDVEQIINSVPIRPEKIVLFGRSVGSLFAIKALQKFPNVAGIILESAIAELLERLLLRVHPDELGITLSEFEKIVSQAIGIKEILMSYSGPALIMHTRHDGLVEVEHAEKLTEWCAGPTRLKIFPSGNHNDIMFVNAEEYFSEVYSFLRALQT